MRQFEIIFDNTQPQFEQVRSFFQNLITNSTFQEGICELNDQEHISHVEDHARISEVNDQERISQVNEMEKESQHESQLDSVPGGARQFNDLRKQTQQLEHLLEGILQTQNFTESLTNLEVALHNVERGLFKVISNLKRFHRSSRKAQWDMAVNGSHGSAGMKKGGIRKGNMKMSRIEKNHARVGKI
ncbi:hypothetical protein GJ744_001280 [Endocarpon pusillum]|uniref:Uncharacterized protein n=1 Tax=Endocarpon pusillum TaxID=364733 RepID=A0A8H7E3C8_9EURO|nr:hypothetical protein GJ744_001280 [Endocarpon pusillum]